MKLLRSLRVVIATILLSLNSIFHVTPLLVVALVKAVFRVRSVQSVCDRVLMAIAASWIDVNSWMFDHLTDTQIVVTGLPEPMPEGHFLLLCNHQS
ncbi:MAG: acyltransferase, partial [Pseudohongiella sp.]|nr:acyltransferase [Pseudohongiella sp.]